MGRPRRLLFQSAGGDGVDLGDRDLPWLSRIPETAQPVGCLANVASFAASSALNPNSAIGRSRGIMHKIRLTH